MSKIQSLHDYEMEIKNRMISILNAAGVTQATAAKRLACSPSSLSRLLNPNGTTSLNIAFCEKFARAFCEGEIALLLSDERGDDSAIAHAFNMQRVFYGLPSEVQKGIYDRAVSEGDAFRALLKKR